VNGLLSVDIMDVGRESDGGFGDTVGRKRELSFPTGVQSLSRTLLRVPVDDGARESVGSEWGADGGDNMCDVVSLTASWMEDLGCVLAF